jgi:peroxiredoxin
MIRYAIAAVVAAVVALSPLQAGEFNKKLNIGDAAPEWKNLPGTDDRQHSLADLKDKDVVVMVITCNHCPVAQAYQERIVAFAKQHAGPNSKVALVAINVNNLEEDKMPKMKERAKEAGFNFSYLYDESQQIGRAYGASVTPEFFVLNKERKIVYMGAMDDSQNVKNVKHNYLEPAVEAALKGQKPATAETQAKGCSVKYENKK